MIHVISLFYYLRHYHYYIVLLYLIMFQRSSVGHTCRAFRSPFAKPAAFQRQLHTTRHHYQKSRTPEEMDEALQDLKHKVNVIAFLGFMHLLIHAANTRRR